MYRRGLSGILKVEDKLASDRHFGQPQSLITEAHDILCYISQLDQFTFCITRIAGSVRQTIVVASSLTGTDHGYKV